MTSRLLPVLSTNTSSFYQISSEGVDYFVSEPKLVSREFFIS